MSGPNTTGRANSEDYNLGRGSLYFAELDANLKPKAYRLLGNCPALGLSIEGESLEHYSSISGLKQLDTEVSISQKLKCSFTLDEFNDENLALLFSGEKATHTNVAVAGFTSFLMVADGNLERGRWYDIKNSAGARAYDVEATKLAITTNETSPIPLVKDTDYELDAEMGRIFILSTSTKAATAIGTSDGLLVTLTADAGAKAVNEVRALTNTVVSGALKFISENAVDGSKREFQFHKIKIKAEGDTPLIGDDWSTMQFNGAAEQNTAADSNSPTLTVRSVAA